MGHDIACLRKKISLAKLIPIQVWFEFSFPAPTLVADTKVKEPSLFYYLHIAGESIAGFILFPIVLVP